MNHSPIRVAVIGAGKLGSRHAQMYASNPEVTLVGVCDTDSKRARDIAAECKTEAFTDYKKLIGKIDAASIVVPSDLHYEISKFFLQNKIHLLIEKPITTNLAQADELLEMAKNVNVTLQVGHIERFNTAIRSIKNVIKVPRFMECHRLGPYDPRVAETSVVLDLMIHDIDIVLDLVRSPIKSIDCVGAYILSKTEDIANARIRFENGCVCDLTASRVTPDKVRKTRIFQDDAYISLDYATKEVEIYTKGLMGINHKKIEIAPGDALREELSDFINCVKSGKRPLVSGEEGRNALKLALEISMQIQTMYKK